MEHALAVPSVAHRTTAASRARLAVMIVTPCRRNGASSALMATRITSRPTEIARRRPTATWTARPPTAPARATRCRAWTVEEVPLGGYHLGVTFLAIIGLRRPPKSEGSQKACGGRVTGVIAVPTHADRMRLPFARMVAACAPKGILEPIILVVIGKALLSSRVG